MSFFDDLVSAAAGLLSKIFGGGAQAPAEPEEPGVPDVLRAQMEPPTQEGEAAGVPAQPAAIPGGMIVSSDDLQRIMPHLPAARLDRYYPFLASAMAEFGIATPARSAAFLAQVAHESAEFRYLEEIASGEAYEGRADLGNRQPGDGRRFKGRGVIQLTGRANYRACGKALGLPLEDAPYLAAEPPAAFRIAGWFWATRRCNALADLGDEDAFRRITKLINGGYNGLASRERYYAVAREVLGV